MLRVFQAHTASGIHVRRTPSLQGTTGGSKNRLTQLDALRAFAVTLVVWAHTGGREIHVFGYRIGGYEGVQLFFVISGFLITGILLDSRAGITRKQVSWPE